MTGVLAGKTLVAVTAGKQPQSGAVRGRHPGRLGLQRYGQLGNGSSATSSVPVVVDRSGVLAGKTVIAMAAGNYHSLALCSDGTLAAWGYNDSGQLGNGSTIASKVPVLVDRTGRACRQDGRRHRCGDSPTVWRLCADGTLAAWGDNSYGQLGNNTAADNQVPVLVDRTGVLAGKTVIAIAAGDDHSLALCSDGNLAAWGYNDYGQLGNNSTTNRQRAGAGGPDGRALRQDGHCDRRGIPSQPGACARMEPGRMGIQLQRPVGQQQHDQQQCAGVGGHQRRARRQDRHCHHRRKQPAVCAVRRRHPGRMGIQFLRPVGQQQHDQLQRAGVRSPRTALRAGERFVHVGISSSAAHSLALVASPPPAVATTLAATGITDTAATLNGSVNANGSSTTVSFEYGLTTAYGTRRRHSRVRHRHHRHGVSATLGGLLPGTTYHYRVVATSGRHGAGEDLTFTTSDVSLLAGLTLSGGTLPRCFRQHHHQLSGHRAVCHRQHHRDPGVRPRHFHRKVNGTGWLPARPAAPSTWRSATMSSPSLVTAAGGTNTLTYTVTVTRLPAVFTFTPPPTCR